MSLMMKTFLGFCIFLLLWASWQLFMTTTIWTEPEKIPCYVICIWRWHTLMRTSVDYRTVCYCKQGWKNTFLVKKNSLKASNLLENLLFCCDTTDIRSRACSPGWKMKHGVFMGHLEYTHAWQYLTQSLAILLWGKWFNEEERWQILSFMLSLFLTK